MMGDAEFKMFADKGMFVVKRTYHFNGGNRAVFDENAESIQSRILPWQSSQSC